MTECTDQQFVFQPLTASSSCVRTREIVARFDGGAITSDAGGLLLREADRAIGLMDRLAACFTDHRNPELIEHTVRELLAQRVYGLALGYEDLNDHDLLRCDPLLATLADKADPTGHNRRREEDRGNALAGKSTLNRLELTPADASVHSRYKKIVTHPERLDQLFVDLFLQAHPTPPAKIVLDVDATDDPLHGKQEGRFFHGYYRCYCYMPLYIFCGQHLLCARLRRSDCDAAAGTVDELRRIVPHIRERWPEVEIELRGDSGFCREAIMTWCEQHGVHYTLGLAKNARLLKKIEQQLKKAAKQHVKTGRPARVFRDFRYRTLDTWSKTRRVIGKAEHLAGGRNPRFIVTSYPKQTHDARTLYEDDYCERGEMENRIKEQQLYLFADRTSTHEMRSNQLRLYLSSMAYTLMLALRRLGLQGTELAKAQCHTIRLRLLKIGAQVRVSVRRVLVSMASSHPYAAVLAQAYHALQAAVP